MRSAPDDQGKGVLSKDDPRKGRHGEERWQGEISPLYLAGISQQRWQPERWQGEEEHGGDDDEQATMAPTLTPTLTLTLNLSLTLTLTSGASR